MITDTVQKQIQMEQRDVNYILPRYIVNYLFQSKNEDPVEIVFPMFSSVPHPTKPGVKVPIRWVPEISPEAMEIKVDGAGVAEATEEEIAAKDEVDEMRKAAKAAIEPAPALSLADEMGDEDAYPEELSPARAAFAEVAKEEPPAEPEAEATEVPPPTSSPLTDVPTTREIKGPPSGPTLPPGTPLDNMAPRDRTDQTRVAKDLRPEPEIDESKEVETSIEKPKEE